MIRVAQWKTDTKGFANISRTPKHVGPWELTFTARWDKHSTAGKWAALLPYIFTKKPFQPSHLYSPISYKVRWIPTIFVKFIVSSNLMIPLRENSGLFASRIFGHGILGWIATQVQEMVVTRQLHTMHYGVASSPYPSTTVLLSIATRPMYQPEILLASWLQHAYPSRQNV